eukprot:365617-Chlamydomonas_euryale.AAC.21
MHPDLSNICIYGHNFATSMHAASAVSSPVWRCSLSGTIESSGDWQNRVEPGRRVRIRPGERESRLAFDNV